MNIGESKSEKNYAESNKNNIVTIIKGSAIALAISLIGLLVLSIILTYTNLSENFTVPIIIMINAVSIIIGSMISVKKVKNKGYINGGIVGFIYILCIYILSSMIVTGFTFNLTTGITILIAIIAGIIGGIIGINIKK